MKDFEPMKRGEWGFPEPLTTKQPAQLDDEGDMLTIAWLDGFHRGKEKRTWVGLTEKEILECRSANHLYFYKAIEAKLKEKNA